MISRDDILKVVVGLLVLGFVLQTFMYQGQGNYNGSTEPTPTPEATGIIGNADSSATITSYPDGVITITGTDAANDAQLRSMLRNLSSEGKVAYFNSAGADSVNVVLTRGANVSEAGWRLTSGFPSYTLSAKAQLSLPDTITFQTQNGSVSAPVRFRASMIIEPLLAEGENISVYITAMLIEGAVSQMQVELAETEGIITVPGTIVRLDEIWFADAEVPWEGRNSVNESALSALLNATYPNSTLAYQARPFIAFERNATASEKGQMDGLNYTLMPLGDMLLVDESFVDRAQAEADLNAIFNSTNELTFPPSLLTVNITSASVNESQLGSAMGVAGLRLRRSGGFHIGDVVEVGGSSYVLAGGATLERAFPANATLGDTVQYLISVRIRGARIIAIQ